MRLRKALSNLEDHDLPEFTGMTRIVAGIAAGLFITLAVFHFSYTPDDTYIYLQYAKKIAAGKGFSFNGGEHSYGTTGPLWALLIAGGRAVGLAPYAVAKSFDLSFSILSIVCLYLLANHLLRSVTYGLLASILFSMDAWFIRWSGSGMETSFAVFLSILGVWLSLRNRALISGFVFGLLTLTRPEAGLLSVIMISRSMFARSERDTTTLERIQPLVAYLLVVLPWLLFSYIHFGTILPNTLYGKSGGLARPADIAPNFMTVMTLLAATQLPAMAAVFISFVKEPRHWKEQYYLAAWIGTLSIFYIIDNVQVVSRYLLILTPFLIVAGLAALQHLARSFSLPRGRVIAFIILLVSLTVAENQFVYWTKVKPHLDNFITGSNDCLMPIGRWLRVNTKEDALVFVPDIGMIGFYSDRTICDAGLVSPQVGKAFRGTDFDHSMMQGKYNAILNPEYVIDRSPTRDRLASATMTPLFTLQFPGLGIANTDMRYYTVYKQAR